MGKQKICVVCGVKNSGKTTFVEKLIREFGSRGIRTAVIKHDGHDFTCDVPGTDSCRFSGAGAYGVAVFSKNRIFVHRQSISESDNIDDMTAAEYSRWETEQAENLAGLFPDADVILIEGLKNTTLPKIEIVRAAVSDAPVSNREGRFLIVTDLPADHFCERVLGFAQIKETVDAIMDEIKYVPEFT